MIRGTLKWLGWFAVLLLAGYLARKIQDFVPDPYRWTLIPTGLILGAVAVHRLNAKLQPTTLGLDHQIYRLLRA